MDNPMRYSRRGVALLGVVSVVAFALSLFANVLIVDIQIGAGALQIGRAESIPAGQRPLWILVLLLIFSPTMGFALYLRGVTRLLFPDGEALWLGAIASLLNTAFMLSWVTLGLTAHLVLYGAQGADSSLLFILSQFNYMALDLAILALGAALLMRRTAAPRLAWGSIAVGTLQFLLDMAIFSPDIPPGLASLTLFILPTYILLSALMLSGVSHGGAPLPDAG